MSRNNLPADWDKEEHPSLELLRQYQSGEVQAPLRHRLEQHLLSCELCSDLVEGMSLARPASVKTAVRETRGRLKHLLSQRKRKKKVFQWPVWQTAAVLLVLVFAIAEVIYHHYFAQPNDHFTGKTQPTPPATSSHQVTGIVTDASGQKLKGAWVEVKGGAKLATTGNHGEFTLTLPPEGATLVISFHGFQPKEVAVTPGIQPVKIILDKTE